MITIDGVKLPTPAKYNHSQQDIDAGDAGRNELGILKRNRVRQGIHKIDLAWDVLTESQMRTVINAIQPSSVTVKFYTADGMKTAKMYAGDRKMELVKYFDPRDRRWNVSYNLIEF